MWAVNKADLSTQTTSGYVHVVMLHYGLGVDLTVADLLPLLPPPVRRLRALLALCPSLCLPKCPQQWMRCFHAQEFFASFSKMPSSEATSNCSASGSALTKSDSLVLSSCSWRCLWLLKTSSPEAPKYGFFPDIIPSAADPPNGIEDSYRLCKFRGSDKLPDGSQEAV